MRTAIPVDGRFEHVVLSCNATSDHAIVWVEREAEKALQVSRALILKSLWLWRRIGSSFSCVYRD